MARARAPVADVDDDTLVARFLDGDRGAFATLYQRYADRVFARLTRLIGPGSDREDLLQLVFLSLFRALPGFRGDASISTFIYRITVHVACDHLRRRQRRRDYDPDALDELIDGSPTPEARARQRAELRQILLLLERVKPAKRVAFVLVAVEGLSLDEVAAMVEAKPDAVKQRVLHARRELVAMMDRAEKRTQRRAP
ncbi:MAG TPA: RNA polymerase sigma factor [Kofleriaceae bacterium]|nr:RNA polymerase sigma factor [Kofleriaceae bacterium]